MRLFRTITTSLGATLLLGGVLATPAAAGPGRHQIVDLGTLGGAYSFASAVNDRGDVTGQSADANGSLKAFRWHGGRMTDLGVLDPSVPYAFGADINNRGWVVGTSDVAGGTATHAFLWRDGVLTDLGTLGGATSSASAVNDRGQVVGRSQTAAGQWHAFLWQDGTMTDLGLDTATGINQVGQITGASPFGDFYRAYRWRNGAVTDLGDLGSGFSDAAAINAQGHVTGTSSLVHYGVSRAYLYRTSMVDLGTLGGLSAYVVALNDRDEVLGASETAGGSVDAFLWRDGRMVDLTAAGVVPAFAQARDLNNRGQIAGSYYPDTTTWQPHAALFS